MNYQTQTIRFQQDKNGITAKECFQNFLRNFSTKSTKNNANEEQEILPYKEEANLMRQNKRTTMNIDAAHLITYDDNLYQYLVQHFYKVEPYLIMALQEFIFQMTNEPQEKTFYTISFYNLPIGGGEGKIRDLKANKIGKLQAIYGTVTRSSEVRPELISATFQCLMCNRDITNILQQFKFTEPKFCSNVQCKNTTQWKLIIEKSLFTDFQKIRVQEDSKDIPPGSMPRSTDLILRNELVDQAKPGDKCVFSGMMVVVPDITSLLKPGEKSQIETKSEGLRGKNMGGTEGITGLKQLGQRDLTYKTIFMVNHVQGIQNRFNERDSRDDEEEDLEVIKSKMSQQELESIRDMASQEDLYKKMADSICPSIHGHEEIKKGILLMLLGGLNKKTPQGINLRGDLNICVVGDPSTAKSQFLKFVNNFLPRSVYTSGKASTAAGLTASVQRDPETGEMCIEAGALMLADNGICCIDEFDKMDSKDQVALHEAMEQQTISIAKAGIQATLNARASVLAAANPVYGRYDKSKSLKNNLNISAPIMSRFDLFFVVLDECNDLHDKVIAKSIVDLHRKVNEPIEKGLFNKEQLQRYIKFAREAIKPEFTKQAAEEVQKKYVSLRMNDISSQKTSYRITVRQLESLIRLSEALARLNLNNQVTAEHVREAARLLSNSILKIEKPDLDIEEVENNVDFARDDKIVQQEMQMQEEEERKLKGKVKLTYDQYNNIGNFVIQYVKQQTRRMVGENQDEAIVSVVQEQIAEEYVQQNIESMESVEMAQRAAKVVHSVIQRLITKDQILIVVEGDDSNFKQRKLQLHQNYTEDI